MGLKLFTAFNALGVLAWLPTLPLSLFFWEDAGHLRVLLILIGMYGGTILSFSALLLSLINLRSRLGDLGSSKYWILAGTVASLGAFGFLVWLKEAIWGW